MEIVLGIILLLAAIFLVFAILMQNGKSHKLSGAIAGGAETFFGKTKGATIDKTLNTLTTIVAIVFVLIVVIMYMVQPDTDTVTDNNAIINNNIVVTDTTDVAEVTEAEGIEEAEEIEETEEVTEAANEEATEADVVAE